MFVFSGVLTPSSAFKMESTFCDEMVGSGLDAMLMMRNVFYAE